MLGYISLLKEQHDPGDSHYTILSKIDEAGSRAADLVEQLLAFSRRGKFESHPLNINKRIEEVLEILKHTIPKQIGIKARLSKHLPSVKGDPTQLDQVIMNICLNGVQAMAGKGTLTIATEVVSPDQIDEKVDIDRTIKTFVSLSISDTGVGMDSTTMKHIFEPFFTTKGLGKGTGLGLSMVYGVVKNHGGGISVSTELHKGTTFYVYLPSDGETVVEQRSEGRDANSVSGKGTILVVDDEDVFREMLKDVLEYLGYEVLTARNGKEGIDVFTSNQSTIDLVILDMNMPVMGGRELFKELKRLQPGVKALLATGFTLNEEAQTLMDEGVKGFIQKPFRMDTISKAIDDVLKLNL